MSEATPRGGRTEVSETAFGRKAQKEWEEHQKRWEEFWVRKGECWSRMGLYPSPGDLVF